MSSDNDKVPPDSEPRELTANTPITVGDVDRLVATFFERLAAFSAAREERRSVDWELAHTLRALEVVELTRWPAEADRRVPEKVIPPAATDAPTEHRLARPTTRTSAAMQRASFTVFGSHVRSGNRSRIVFGCSLRLPSGAVSMRPNPKVAAGLIALVLIGAAVWFGRRVVASRSPQEEVRIANRTPAPPLAAPSIAAAPLAAPSTPAPEPSVATESQPEPAKAARGRAEGTEQKTQTAQRSRSRPSASQAPSPAPVAGPVEEPKPPAVSGPGASSIPGLQKLADRARAAAETPERPVPASTASSEATPPAGPGSGDPPAAEEPATPPVPVIKILPAYPETARSQNIGGRVELKAWIDQTGKVTGVSWLSGATELRPAAQEAILKWRFKPAVRNGADVPGERMVTFEFGEQVVAVIPDAK